MSLRLCWVLDIGVVHSAVATEEYDIKGITVVDGMKGRLVSTVFEERTTRENFGFLRLMDIEDEAQCFWSYHHQRCCRAIY